MGICDDMRRELKAGMRKRAIHLKEAEAANVRCSAPDTGCAWCRPDRLCMLLIPDEFKGVACKYQEPPSSTADTKKPNDGGE